MFKRLSLLCFFFLSLQGEPLSFNVRGESALLMNADTGHILFKHQEDVRYYPASTTKIATALFALKIAGDRLDMEIVAEQESLVSLSEAIKKKNQYKSPSYYLEPDGMHIGIKKGEILTLKALLQGTLIASGNDAANVVAQALGPSIPTFMSQLNAYLKEIGCQKTHFCNPHGLHDPSHETTAFDLAVMAKEALKHPVFKEIVSQSRFLRPKTNKQAAATFLQTNRLLRPGKFYYSKAIGVKTGWHSKANKTFVGAAQNKDRTLIAVLMGYKNSDLVFEDAIQLFEKAFNQPKISKVFLKGGVQTFSLELDQANAPLKTYLEKPLSLEFFPAEDPQPKCLLYWKSLSVPIQKDSQVGEIQLISSKGELLKSVPLLAFETVDFNSFHKFLAWITSHFIVIFLGCITVALLIYFIFKN